jgi:hypothetical protein
LLVRTAFVCTLKPTISSISHPLPLTLYLTSVSGSLHIHLKGMPAVSAGASGLALLIHAPAEPISGHPSHTQAHLLMFAADA